MRQEIDVLDVIVRLVLALGLLLGLSVNAGERGERARGVRGVEKSAKAAAGGAGDARDAPSRSD